MPKFAQYINACISEPYGVLMHIYGIFPLQNNFFVGINGLSTKKWQFQQPTFLVLQYEGVGSWKLYSKCPCNMVFYLGIFISSEHAMQD